MTRHTPAPRTRALTTAAVLGLVIAACGGGASSPTTAATSVTTAVTTTTAGSGTPAATTTTTGTGTTAATTTTAGSTDGALVAQGEQLFQTTAAGTGCALCHTPEATGDAVIGSPDIRGKTLQDIINAIDTRAQMSYFTVLSTDEIKAIAAYLATLVP